MSANFSHPSPVELADYAARRLLAAAVLQVSDHLGGCDACRETLRQLRPSPSAGRLGEFVLEPAPEGPAFDDLAGMLDGDLTPARSAEVTAELARSPAARDALADLAAFRDELAQLPAKFHHPSNAPTIAPATTFADNVIAVSPGRWYQQAVAWTASLAALLVAVAVGSWFVARPGHDAGELLREADGRVAQVVELPTELRGAVETAARTGQLSPQDATLTTGREIMAGQITRAQMTALSPVGTTVRAPRPLLEWTPRAEATGYVVSISAPGAALVTSPSLPAVQTQWTPPQALLRGQTYQWQVEALRGETVIDRAPKPPVGEARFRILDAAGDQALRELEARDGGVPLVLGVAYWQAGLTAAAADQFHRLAQAHRDSGVARRLEHVAEDGAGSPASPSLPASR